MKHGKWMLCATLLMLMLFLGTGCGNSQTGSTDKPGTSQETGSSTDTKQDAPTQDSDMIADEPAAGADDLGVNPDGLTGDTGMDGTAGNGVASDSQTVPETTDGAGNNTAANGAGKDSNAAGTKNSTDDSNVGQDARNAVDDVGDAVGSGIKDIGQGVKDITDDVTGTTNR